MIPFENILAVGSNKVRLIRDLIMFYEGFLLVARGINELVF